MSFLRIALQQLREKLGTTTRPCIESKPLAPLYKVHEKPWYEYVGVDTGTPGFALGFVTDSEGGEL